MSRFHVIVDLGYGDAGKGVFTDFLASTLRTPIVVRYNGGHQCGHTVRLPDGTSHIFSNFGSGTLRGVPTFFSKYCTIDPIAMQNEGNVLESMDVDPILYVDAMAKVTTELDQWYNQQFQNKAHGSVGVGFGATMERNETPYKLHAMDLSYPEVVREKLVAIEQYYTRKVGEKVTIIDIDEYVEGLCNATRFFEIKKEHEIINPSRYENIIFEGGQGVMLDMEFGFFPHVTRSYTTSRNAMEMITRHGFHVDMVEAYYLTRAYATRHGAGPFKAEKFPVELINNEQETNVTGEFQGDLRTGILDMEILRYAIECEWNYSSRARQNLVVSCLDQLKEFKLQTDGTIDEYKDRDEFLRGILDGTSFDQAYINDSPYSSTIQKVYPNLL